MSYILNALKKSERERTLLRGVGFGDAGRRSAPQALWSLGLISVVGIAAIAIAAVGAVSWRSNTPAPNVASVEPVATAPVVPPVVSELMTKTPPGAGIRSLSAEATVHSESNTSLADNSAGTRSHVGEARFLSAMSSDFQRRLPAMTVNIHVYAPGELQRILYVNNRQYRRGDEISNGVVVEEIVPDGVVLQFRGQRFKLPRPS